MADIQAEDVISYDEGTRIFTIENLSDISLAGAEFTDYTITVKGVTGNIASQT